MLSFKIAIPALIAAMTAAPAFAAPAEDMPTAAVHFGDLDLKTSDGLARLNKRISRAAANICNVGDLRDPKNFAAARDCREVALNRAAPEIELAVAAAHRGEGYASSGSSINVRSR
jgi:UrcA family protein